MAASLVPTASPLESVLAVPIWLLKMLRLPVKLMVGLPVLSDAEPNLAKVSSFAMSIETEAATADPPAAPATASVVLALVELAFRVKSFAPVKAAEISIEAIV